VRFYDRQHAILAGIDLHASTLHCASSTRQAPSSATRTCAAAPTLSCCPRPLPDDLILGVECMFAWYWPPTSRPGAVPFLVATPTT